mmetsp:Transcript_8331/g.13652  ORF Transcript_8331/g.13652 Transcript_8331/m.13652 type:complete len:210 (+) Transcript_8331:40-669(+)
MAAQNRFSLPPLPYAKNALEKGGISSETVEYHYGKHHAGYVRKLNAADQAGKVRKNASLTDLILTEKENSAIFNLAAQIYNHTFYWESMAPASDGCTGKICQALQSQFGSCQEFMKQFKQRAGTHFGSGWVWLSLNQQLKLVITDGHDACNPLRDGLVPVLCIDVWEHAYYVDQRNDRAAYIDNFVSLINWERVEQRYNDAVSKLKSSL